MMLSYDPALVEEAVLLAERTASPVVVRRFRHDRDRAYDVQDSERREAGFRALHLRWFIELGLGDIISQCLAERPQVATSLTDGRVVRALTAAEERADLVDRVGSEPGDWKPMLLLRLRPSVVVDPPVLQPLLRHELYHISDMLDPAFGYERASAVPDGDPAYDTLVRERYRVLWDVTIDGRLVGAGLLGGHVRESRWREFATTFRMPADEGRALFGELFGPARPTHAGLLALARHPRATGAARSESAGCCPLCRFPAADLAPFAGQLSSGARHVIARSHPQWTIDQGLCRQCLDLYEARYTERQKAVC